jgi:hypothetical protein
MTTMTSTALGAFVMGIAQGVHKTQQMSDDQARQAREQLAVRISPKVEEIRQAQRKNFDESKAVTVF